ncbi:MAG: hypothetical protein D6B28_00900 [Gammaproteobacteria bacterium]|nr:MAG: hypothetical protein D6B28_00900 [Gammaproteobacteria bacterium]
MSSNTPAKVDFSKRAISKAIMKNSIQHPLVLYPGAIGILGGAAALLLGPTVIPIAAAAAGGIVSIGALLTNFTVRKEQITNDYVQSLHEQLSHSREQNLTELKAKLQQAKSEQGLDQLERLQEKFELLEQILSEKLNPGEISFNRYLGIAEQVFLSVIDNLNEVTTRINSIKAIDIDFINSKMLEMDRLKNIDEHQRLEMESYSKRHSIYNEQQKTIKRLFAQNESAMTVIDETTAALSGITTRKGMSTLDLETAMQELSKLANRADDYSIGK